MVLLPLEKIYKLDLLLCNCPEIIKNVMMWSPGQSNFPSDLKLHRRVNLKFSKHFIRANPVTRRFRLKAGKL